MHFRKLLAGGLICAVLATQTQVMNLSSIGSIEAWAQEGAAAAAPTFSKYWFQDETGNWKVKDAAGKIITNVWLCDDAVAANGKEIWYLLDANGNLVTAGLVQDAAGNFYSLETNHNGYFGMLRYRSQVYDGVNLVLEANHNGSFGKILNGDGVESMKAKYGVTAIGINPDNCVYTSSFGGAGGPGALHGGGGPGVVGGGSGGSGGGGGGGSSSGGGGGGGSSSGGGGSWIEDDDDVIDDEWEDYDDDSVSWGPNDFKNGNYTMMSDSQIEKMDEAIAEFKAEYITAGMTDFEKELQIVQWLVENCEYELGENWERATAYSCIVLGKAQCSGYADAFLQTAKACGLDVRYVRSDNHAWNLVKLDGAWYHVDVTWEDPTGSTNGYGFGNLRNMYINLPDKEIREERRAHSQWSPTSIKANDTAYNFAAVRKYMKTGVIDKNAMQELNAEFDAMVNEVRDSNRESIFRFESVEKTGAAVLNYMDEVIKAREPYYSVGVLFDDYSYLSAKKSLAIYDQCDEIENYVNAELNARYKDVLEQEMKLFLSRNGENTYRRAFAADDGRITYKEGHRPRVDYVIRFIDRDTHQVVGQQTGTEEINKEILYKFPEGYNWIDNKSHTIHSGNVRNNGKSFTIQSKGAVNMDVMVQDTTMVNWTVEYVDRYHSAKPLAIAEGRGKVGSSFTPEIKNFEGYVLYKQPQSQVLREESRLNRFRVEYGKTFHYTVKYVCDTDGETLETVTGTALENSQIEIEKKTFENHTVVTNNFSQKVEKDGAVFTIHYKRNLETFTYNVLYLAETLDESYFQLEKVTGLTGKEGSKVTLEKKSFEGYQLKPGQNLRYTLTEDGATFAVYYQKLCDYTVSYVREDNKAEVFQESGTAVLGTEIEVEERDFSRDGLEYVSGAGTHQITEDNQKIYVYYKVSDEWQQNPSDEDIPSEEDIPDEENWPLASPSSADYAE